MILKNKFRSRVEARIEVNTDATSGATMYFALKSNVTSGANTTLTNVLDLICREKFLNWLKTESETNKVTIIGFSIKDRFHAQVENKIINYPNSSVQYHLFDDRKIYKILKHKIKFLGN